MRDHGRNRGGAGQFTAERGQALTLEGSIAAVLLVLGLLFALQVSAVTPLTESTSSQHIENQQEAIGANLLSVAADEGILNETVLYWDERDGENSSFVNGSIEADGAYTGGVPTTSTGTDDSPRAEAVYEFGDLLERSFTDRGIAYNIDVNYLENGSFETQPLVDQGQPSDHAVTVTRHVTVYDDDSPEGSDEPLSTDNFYASSETTNSPIYAVMEVELTIWRM